MNKAEEATTGNRISPWWMILFVPLSAIGCAKILSGGSMIPGFLVWVFLRLITARVWRGIDSLKTLGAVLFYELTPLICFVLTLFGSSVESVLLKSPLAETSPAVVWGGAIGLLAPVFAWRLGDAGAPRSRARLWIGVLTVAANYETAWKAVALAHDQAISRIIDSPSLDMGIVVFVVALAGSGAMFFLLLSFDWLWKLAWLNRFALWLIRGYLKRDPTGRVHALLRHAGHKVKKIVTWPWRIFRIAWQFCFGKFPAHFEPLQPHESRYEQLLWEEILKGDEEIVERAGDWRIAQLKGRDEANSEAVALGKVISRQAKLLIALGDYLVCPYCELDDQPRSLTLKQTWELSRRTDRMLWTAQAVADQHGSIGEDPQALVLSQGLNERLSRYYELLSMAAEDSSTMELITFRLETLEIQAGEFHQLLWKQGFFTRIDTNADIYQERKKRLDDLRRLNWRGQVLSHVESHMPDSDQARNEFWVSALLAEFRRVSDWMGMIEADRLLRLRKTYSPTGSDHLDLGEAYWRQAQQLGAGALGQWSWDRAIARLRISAAAGSLDKLATPYQQ